MTSSEARGGGGRFIQVCIRFYSNMHNPYPEMHNALARLPGGSHLGQIGADPMSKLQ